MAIARQRVAKHIPAHENVRNSGDLLLDDGPEGLGQLKIQ
jgi:hypothetical protein